MFSLVAGLARFSLRSPGLCQWENLELVPPGWEKPLRVAGHKAGDPFFASGSFLMFPWVNRLEKNPFAKLPFYPSPAWFTDSRGLSLHGLYAELPRQILSQSETELSLVPLLPQAWRETILGKIQVVETYRLSSQELSIGYKIINLADEDFSFALGIHSYFQLGEDTNLDDVYLFGSPFQEVQLGDQLLPERILPNIRFGKEEIPLQNQVFDHLFRKASAQSPSLGIALNRLRVRLVVSGDSSVHFFQVYTPPHRQSIALEPMTSSGNFLGFSESHPVVLRKKEECFVNFLIRVENF